MGKGKKIAALDENCGCPISEIPLKFPSFLFDYIPVGALFCNDKIGSVGELGKNQMKYNCIKFIFLFIFLVGCVSLPGCGRKGGEQAIPPDKEKTTPITFLYDHAAGLEIARQTKKPTLTFFSVPDNTGSMRMMETTFSDDEVKRLAERLVCICVDGSQESTLCESLQISSFPTIILSNANGTEVRRLVGRQTPDQLAIQIHILLQVMAQRPTTTVF